MDLDSLFKQQSERDLKSARIMYAEHDYGNAVFLYQQAVEKAFKYVMMKYELAAKDKESLKKMTHKPAVAFLKKLEQQNRKFVPKNNAEKQVKLVSEKFSVPIQTLFKELEGSTISNKVWWKISLEIELDDDEERNARCYLENGLNGLICTLQQIKNEILRINARRDNRITEMLAEAHEGLKAYQIELKNELSKKPLTKLSNETQRKIDNFLKNLLYECHVNKHKYDKEWIGILVIGMWLIIHNLTLLKITPHEEFGRYPEKIESKSTFIWYKKNVNQLKSLIDDVEKAVISLYSL